MENGEPDGRLYDNAIELLNPFLPLPDKDELKDFLPETIEIAQDFLLGEQIAMKAKRKMKTTLVSMLTDGNRVYIAHVGDSRCYAFSKRKVKFRTLDHSVPQMLVISHEIKEPSRQKFGSESYGYSLGRWSGIRIDEGKKAERYPSISSMFRRLLGTH